MARTRRRVTKKRTTPRSSRRSRRSRARWWAGGLALLLALLAWGVLALAVSGERAVRHLRRAPRLAPVRVLSTPPVLAKGMALDPGTLAAALRALGYRETRGAARLPGSWRLRADGLEIYRRACPVPGGRLPAAWIRVVVRGGRVARLLGPDGRPVSSFTLEPLVLGAFRGPRLQERRPRPLAAFPERLVRAVLAAEDSRFWRHRGIDPRAVLRALLADLRGGGPLQGGSTITQQLVKNRLVGSRRTLGRKVREALLAAWIETRMSKEEILAAYLNEVYLGQDGPVSIVGLPAASRFWFGKDVGDLELPEMATLAGMISSPGRFDPRRHPEAARKRRNWVLGRMAALGWLDPSEAEAARRAPLAVVPPPRRLDPAGDVLDAVRRELVRRGWEPAPGPVPVTVHTSIDPFLERRVRRALAGQLRRLERERPSRRPLEGAVVVLRPATGEVIALVGGREGTPGGFDRALAARRQPGSSFKPFVALAALASGRYVPASRLADAPLEVPTPRGPWRPRNHDGTWHGVVTLREALVHSWNVPFVRLGLALGHRELARRASAVGFDQVPDVPSLPLGTLEVSPLELAAAYGTLGTLGRRVRPHLVRGLAAGEGETAPALRPVPAGEPVVPASACWMVLDMMRDVARRGTGRRILSWTGGRVPAVKTGTSQRGRDAWFALVSGNAVVVAWVGRDDGKPAALSGAGAALPVVGEIVRGRPPDLLAPLPDPPPDVAVVEIDPETGGRATPGCPSRVREVFPRDRVPGPCPRHRSFLGRVGGKLRGLFRGRRGGREEGESRR